MSTRLPEYIETNSGGWITDVNATSPLKRARQGVLDELLRKGLWLPPPTDSRDGLIVMLRGKAGTGKSTLALELAANLRIRREPGTTPPAAETEFLSLEQDAAELKAIVCRLIANQCRARLALLAAMRPDDDITDDMVREAATMLGIVSGEDPASDKLIRAVLRQDPEKEADRSGEWAVLLRDSRIRFHGRDGSSQLFGDDPLERAYSFLSQGWTMTESSPEHRFERPVVFIDGLSILSGEDRSRLQMAALIEMLRQRCLIGIVAYEPSSGVEESLDHQVDVVIELEEKHLSEPIDYLVHALHFKKTRYQEAALGWHQYKIRGYGIDIYPSVHFQVHSHGYMPRQLMGSLKPIRSQPEHLAKEKEKQEAKIEKGWSVIEQVLGGIKPGDSIALLGPRGAFKTALTLDFLFRSRCQPDRDANHQPEQDPAKAKGPFAEDACARNQAAASPDAQRGLLVSVIDNEDTLRIQKACPLVKEGEPPCDGFSKCCDHTFLFYQRPGAITSSEFLYYLKTRLQVAIPPIRRLAFWDLTQIEYRFPLLANDPMFIPALLDLFKIKRVKSMFMGAANARLSNTIAAVADNVLFCWRDRVRPEFTERSHENMSPEELKKRDRVEPKFIERVTAVTNRLWAKTNQKGMSYLMVYVDRTSGGFAQERKNLHAFPILDGFQLFVPAGTWKLEDYAIHAEQIPWFEEAEKQIRHVTEMQGFVSNA